MGSLPFLGLVKSLNIKNCWNINRTIPIHFNTYSNLHSLFSMKLDKQLKKNFTKTCITLLNPAKPSHKLILYYSIPKLIPKSERESRVEAHCITTYFLLLSRCLLCIRTQILLLWIYFFFFIHFHVAFCVCIHIYGWLKVFIFLHKKFIFTLTLELDFFLMSRKYGNNEKTKNVNLFRKKNCDVFLGSLNTTPHRTAQLLPFIFCLFSYSLQNLIVLFEFDFSRTTQEKHNPQMKE